MEVVILIIVLAIVVIGGGVAAFMHGRGTTTIEPPARPAPTKAPPRPKTEVDEGDVIVVFALAADVPEVERLFQVSIDFF